VPVRRFQAGEVPIFLISLKAGGVGLNLTAADTVIHYDPWWNPAVENQATDRAHRLGQDKPVFVYKLIIAGSIEEKILALQERKADLAAGILSEDLQRRLKFGEDDLAALLRKPCHLSFIAEKAMFREVLGFSICRNDMKGFHAHAFYQPL
jgi:SNF2 family DNA or RNA helicase